MSLSVINSGGSTFITTLEGRKCVEYLASLKPVATAQLPVDAPSPHAAQEELTDNECTVRQRKRTTKDDASSHTADKSMSVSEGQQYWELVRLREFPVSLSQWEDLSTDKSPAPTCIASGGSGAGSCLAIGTDTGSVLLIDRHSMDSVSSLQYSGLKVYAVYPDVSDGQSADVLSVTLSGPVTLATDETDCPSGWPLLATVSAIPDWGHLRVWRVPSPGCGVPVTPLDPSVVALAVASCSSIPGLATSSAKATSPANRSGPGSSSSYRFRHCRFMAYRAEPHRPPVDATPVRRQHTLATTVQPLCAGRSSYSYLVVWSVPVDRIDRSSDDRVDSSPAEPIRLAPLAQTALPQGHLPACLAVHPCRSRALIAVGTMDGRVDVYFLSPSDPHRLSCVYSLAQAHSTFVTAVAFLPSVSVGGSNGNGVTSPRVTSSDCFQLVSTSIDCRLLWHPGPTCLQIGCLARDPPDVGFVARLASSRFAFYRLFVGLFLFSLLPIFLVLLDSLLAFWL